MKSMQTRLASLMFSLVLATGLISVLTTEVQAQSPSGNPTIEQSATYVSPVDDAMTIRKIAVLPVSDNVDGIYARPVESELISLVKDSHRWDQSDVKVDGAMPSLADLEEKPAEFQKLVKKMDADAFIASAIVRGQSGLTIRLDLFLKSDGKLLVQEIFSNPRTEIPQLKEEIKIVYDRLVAKLPYQGLILSRQNNRVTINLGKSDGLKKDQIVSAVQIITANRHPKFGFLISTDKEILGRIKILKVEDTLSFGAIISEKERGAIKRFAKITSLEAVNYGDPSSLSPDADHDMRKRPDAGVAFGPDAKEWVPAKPPAFGEVGGRAGLGLYNESLSLTGLGCCEAQSSFYPSIMLHAELWLNPQWIARAEMTQGILSTMNPRSGSTPSAINHAYSRYSLVVGYNFLLRDDFFGPKIQLNAGLANARMRVDDSSPRAFTTTSYSGMIIGINGVFPVNDEKTWYLGGKFNLFIFPSFSESPVTSGGDPKLSVNDFSVFLQKKVSENLRLEGSLDFSLFSVSYSGDGNRMDPTGTTLEDATSLSQRHTILSGGVVYMF